MLDKGYLIAGKSKHIHMLYILYINVSACVEILHNFYKFQNYLPSERDWIQLRERVINIVKGIVQKYFISIQRNECEVE